MMKKSLVFLSLIVLMSSLGGPCGSDGDKDTTTGGTTDVLGMGQCFECHIANGIVNEDSKFSNAYTSWLEGPHGNFDFYDSTTYTKSYYSDFIGGSFVYPDDYSKFIGFPDELKMDEYVAEDTEDEFASKSDCLVCHGPSSIDNKAIASMALIGTDGTIDTAHSTQVGRPVVGCEQCHGDGSAHKLDSQSAEGFSKLPGASVCGKCHSVKFPEGYLTYHPMGDGGLDNPGIYEAYLTSPHASSVNEFVYVDDTKKTVQATCSKCHTDEGAKLYQDTDGDYATLESVLGGETALLTFSANQCKTCHNPHNPKEFLESKTVDSEGTTVRSAQFNTCTNCHQLTKGFVEGTADSLETAYHDPSVNSYGSEEEMITDTHFVNPDTDGDGNPDPDGDGYSDTCQKTLDTAKNTYTVACSTTTTYAGVSGIIVDFSAEDSCTRCHNPHSADNTINEQYAESGHGDSTGEAWIHYNWKNNSMTLDNKYNGRQTCQRCHTTTGYSNYTDDPVTYLANEKAYIINNIFVAKGDQSEKLYCNACHTDSAGTRKLVSAANIPVESMNDTTAPTDGYYQLPDWGDSNICVNCHSGRETGYNISSQATPAAGKYYSFKNSHYLGADETMFRLAYQFDGRVYANSKAYAHDIIGTGVVPVGSSTAGPCVICHMGNSESHKWEVVEKDDAGVITEIKSFENVCSKCHSSSAMTATTLETLKDGLADGLNVLSLKLQAKGIFWGSSYPYFFTDATLKTSFSNWSDKNLLGAAFNLNMLLHEPGAYAHNSQYTRRLVFDSIDYSMDSDLDGYLDFSAYPTAAEWFQGDGITATDVWVDRP